MKPDNINMKIPATAKYICWGIGTIVLLIVLLKPFGFAVYHAPGKSTAEHHQEILDSIEAAGYDKFEFLYKTVNTDGDGPVIIDLSSFEITIEDKKISIIVVEDRLEKARCFAIFNAVRTISINGEFDDRNADAILKFVQQVAVAMNRYAPMETYLSRNGRVLPITAPEILQSH